MSYFKYFKSFIKENFQRLVFGTMAPLLVWVAPLCTAYTAYPIFAPLVTAMMHVEMVIKAVECRKDKRGLNVISTPKPEKLEQQQPPSTDKCECTQIL